MSVCGYDLTLQEWDLTVELLTNLALVRVL